MGRIGPWELMLLLAIALVIFGPSKLPEIGKSLGKGIREFKEHSSSITQTVNDATTAPPEPTATKKEEA